MVVAASSSAVIAAAAGRLAMARLGPPDAPFFFAISLPSCKVIQ